MSFISIENLTTRYNTSKGLVHALEMSPLQSIKENQLELQVKVHVEKALLGYL